jgi:hypothetical protein
MKRRLQALDLAADVEPSRTVEQVIHTRMARVDAAQNRRGFGRPIRLPHVTHMQHGQHHALLVAEA